MEPLRVSPFLRSFRCLLVTSVGEVLEFVSYGKVSDRPKRRFYSWVDSKRGFSTLLIELGIVRSRYGGPGHCGGSTF